MKCQIICHGGAWSIPDDLEQASIDEIRIAAKIGMSHLKNGKSAEDAVVEAVTMLENSPTFNAGLGACLTSVGTVELDSMLMRSRDLEIGSVASVRNIKNASQLARHVLHSEHTMIVGEGATMFAKEMGMELVKDCDLITEYERKHLGELQSYAPAVKSIFGGKDSHDTVGAVAMDPDGNFAVCTSTGGVTYKRVGRVGDSPLPGCGGWAEDHGACSTTGHGEGITKVLLAKRIVDEIKQDDVCAACERGVEYMLDKVGSRGGAIALSNKTFGYYFNTQRMPWCYLNETGGAFGINHGENNYLH